MSEETQSSWQSREIAHWSRFLEPIQDGPIGEFHAIYVVEVLPTGETKTKEIWPELAGIKTRQVTATRAEIASMVSQEKSLSPGRYYSGSVVESTRGAGWEADWEILQQGLLPEARYFAETGEGRFMEHIYQQEASTLRARLKQGVRRLLGH